MRGYGSTQSLGTARRGLGRFRYETTEDPRTFIVKVRGIDGPLLLKDSLAKAALFGELHPEGWVWITDVRRLLWTSPRTFRYVRRVRKLPNIRGYYVVAPLPFRILGNTVIRFFGPQRFVRKPKQAMALAAEALG